MHGHGTFKPYCYLLLPIIHSQSPTVVSYDVQDHLKLMEKVAKCSDAARTVVSPNVGTSKTSAPLYG